MVTRNHEEEATWWSALLRAPTGPLCTTVAGLILLAVSTVSAVHGEEKFTDAWRRIEAATRSRKWQDAIRLCDEAIAKFPRERRLDQVLFRKGDLLKNLRQWKKADSVFKQLLKQFPKSRFEPPALRRSGQCLLAVKDVDGAMASYLKLQEKYPAHGETRGSMFDLAMSLPRFKRYKDAIKYSDAIIERYPKERIASQVLLQKARVLKLLKDTQAAESAFRQVVRVYDDTKKYGDDPLWARLELSRLLWGRGQKDESIRLARELAGMDLKRGPCSQAALDCARFLWRTGRRKEAMDFCATILKADKPFPNRKEMLREHGDYLQASGRGEEAAATWKKLLKEYPPRVMTAAGPLAYGARNALPGTTSARETRHKPHTTMKCS